MPNDLDHERGQASRPGTVDQFVQLFGEPTDAEDSELRLIAVQGCSNRLMAASSIGIAGTAVAKSSAVNSSAFRASSHM